MRAAVEQDAADAVGQRRGAGLLRDDRARNALRQPPQLRRFAGTFDAFERDEHALSVNSILRIAKRAVRISGDITVAFSRRS